MLVTSIKNTVKKSIKQAIISAVVTAVAGYVWQNRHHLLPQVFGDPTTDVV